MNAGGARKGLPRISFAGLAGRMVGKNVSLVLVETFRPTVRWTDAFQILGAAIVPAAYRAFGAPMPEGAQVMVFPYVGYAIVSLVALRFLFFAPYAVWKSAADQNASLIAQIGSPRQRARDAIEGQLVSDRLALLTFITAHRIADAAIDHTIDSIAD